MIIDSLIPRAPLAVLCCALLLPSAALAQGDGTFESPFVITNAGRPGPATVHSGDLDGDGRLDLVTAHGSPRILVYFQSPSSREEWRQLPLPVGSQVWFVRTADFTGDGLDDIIASDISATAFFVESLPDRRFNRPKAIPEARGARWSAIGDWNLDGNIDFATANISAADLTVFLGDGAGEFTFSQRLPGSREHTLEAADYDGDGRLDLFLGTGLTGITVHQSVGDGTFTVRNAFEYLGCVEYLAEVGHFEGSEYIVHGDFNGDGRGDLAPTCVETTTASLGISRGDSTYEPSLTTLAGPGVDSTATADLSGDGNADLIIASKGSTSLLVHLGLGDGKVEEEPVVFAPTGNTPVFLVVRDLDRDGYLDVVSADQLSSTLTIFWGKDGERFLESTLTVSGFAAARSMAVGDLDGDGTPDLFFPRSDRPEVQVYLSPTQGTPTEPSLMIATQGRFSFLEVADLDGDGVPDLAGADQVTGKALVTLLDRAGATRGELALDAGIAPSSVEIGRLDEGATLDVAVPCEGSNHLAVFLGQGGGAFANARIVPTVEKPDGIAIEDFDGDGFTDTAVFSATELAVHYGRGGGELDAARGVASDATKLFIDVATGDLDGDSNLDLLVAESNTLSVLVFPGTGGRDFGEAVPINLGTAPGSLVVADLDEDGRLDLTVASPSGRSASVLLGTGNLEFRSLVYGVGIVPAGHRLVDLDGDGAQELVAFSAASATILTGRARVASKPRFLRGDVTADGALAITDPIAILGRLFGGGAPLPCEAAADADDDGNVAITDPIAILGHLFLGSAALPPPGPGACGEDPTADELVCEVSCQ